jgi:probable O-glycosylation ligase (exosortase A-associated)
MLRSTWLLFVYIVFCVLGASAPFIFALGYVWVDTFRPQEVAYIILNDLPVAMIMGALAIGSYFIFDRRSPPRLTLAGAVPALMAVWCTLTMLWAVAPESGWTKWDWAVKTLVFAAFLPLVIRSRVQIEAMAQVYLFALAANIIPFGIKTTISGGGYGINLGLIAGNAGLGEGGQLSTFCLMAVPIALYLSQHARLIPLNIVTKTAYLGIAALSVITALGTFERSALLGAGILGIFMFIRSRRKLLVGTAMVIAASVLIYTSSASFMKRMETISTYSADSSAVIRLLVWRWTLDFSLTHPQGGGFNAYLVNVIELPADGQNPPTVQNGRAFHSSYFEVLGEQGWLGFTMFIAAALSTMISLHRLSKRTRKIPHLAWCADFSDALQSGLAVFLSAGAFVGIAFQPGFWYFIALSVSLREYVRRVNALTTPAKAPSWRPALPADLPAGALPAASGWRDR